MSKRIKKSVTGDDRKFVISPFNVARIKIDSSMLFFGPKRTGKTTAIKHIVKKLNPPRAVAFCGSADAYESTLDFIPATYVYRDLTLFPAILASHRAAQEEHKRRYKKHLKQLSRQTGIHQPFNKDDPVASLKVFYLFDDFGYDQKELKSKSMKEMNSNSRHFGPNAYSFQYPNQCPKEFRGNFDLIFITKITSKENIDLAYSKFQEFFYCKKDFIKILEILTQGYRIMVIDNTVKKDTSDTSIDIPGVSEVERRVSYFEADEKFMEGFVIGDEEYKEYHTKFWIGDGYDDHDDNDDTGTTSVLPPIGGGDVTLLPNFKPTELSEQLSRALRRPDLVAANLLIERGASLTGRPDIMNVLNHMRSDILRWWWSRDKPATTDVTIAALMKDALSCRLITDKNAQLELAMKLGENVLVRSLLKDGASLAECLDIHSVMHAVSREMTKIWFDLDLRAKQVPTIIECMKAMTDVSDIPRTMQQAYDDDDDDDNLHSNDNDCNDDVGEEEEEEDEEEEDTDDDEDDD